MIDKIKSSFVFWKQQISFSDRKKINVKRQSCNKKIEYNGYMYIQRFSCFINTQKKKKEEEEHKRAKDNEEIYSDTRQEKFERKNKKKNEIERRI